MRRTSYIIFLILLSLGLSDCGNSEKKSAEAMESETDAVLGLIQLTEEQFENSGMALGNMEEKQFPITVQVNGMIDVPPENKAVVNATMGGYITRTPLLIGDVVKKGQLLVTLENPEFVRLQQEYMEVKQQLAYLQSEYQRQTTLMDENITSQKSFLKAESEYKSANARYNGLKKQLEMLHISTSEVEKGNISSIATIYAPISGSVTKINVSKGTYVSPATAILEIIDNDHIHLELSVFEKDIMKLKKGQPIHFKIPEASEKVYEAEVHLIGSSIGENRTIKVHGHLHDEAQNNFLTGMFIDAEIETDSQAGKALPETAIVEIAGAYFILHLTNEANSTYEFEQTEVEIGPTRNGFTEIKNPDKFKPSDRFLTKGAFDLLGE
ncbi:efflux RND transporter periplasmic adaptor subunit [Maribacter aestuarii]|uniref:efflux RND transporter periplasmic adaptor subunit n=1 Tax=Maribacter aestuarii TaxID=1130723 RepID=UPI00248CDFB9|nr:efflux RND transporter periplasmic adaptor subunit [Maribacter aestuarii]